MISTYLNLDHDLDHDLEHDLDHDLDFLYQGAKKTRATLKEERAKLKAESVRPR